MHMSDEIILNDIQGFVDGIANADRDHPESEDEAEDLVSHSSGSAQPDPVSSGDDSSSEWAHTGNYNTVQEFDSLAVHK